MLRIIRFIILFSAFCCSRVVFVQQANEPVSRTYLIRFKTVQEFQPLVQALLSNQGADRSL